MKDFFLRLCRSTCISRRDYFCSSPTCACSKLQRQRHRQVYLEFFVTCNDMEFSAFSNSCRLLFSQIEGRIRPCLDAPETPAQVPSAGAGLEAHFGRMGQFS